MSNLENQSPAETYKGLLQVNDYTDGVAGNTGSNALAIQDGAGNATALAISTDRVGIGTTSPGATFHLKANDDSANALTLWVVNKDHTNSIISAYENGDVSLGEFTYKDASGKVGIGTTDPARVLHLKNSNSAVAFETPIDDGGSAFAQIKSSRDGTSGYSSTLEFATTESDTPVENFGDNGSGGSGFVTRMVIDSAGKVGIGTTSPESELHVAGDIILSGLTTSNQGTRAKIVHTSGTEANGDDASNDGGLIFQSNNNGTFVDGLTIDHGGKVGIGTTSPDFNLSVVSDTDPATIGIHGYGSFSDGSVAAQLLFLGKDSSDGNRSLGFIQVREHAHASGTGSMEFHTRKGGNEAARMVIDSNGNVGIGTTSPSSVLEVRGKQGYADSANNLLTSTTKSALRVRGSNDSSYSLWMGVETNNANPYIQGSNGTGGNAVDILINPFGGNVGIGIPNPDLQLDVNGGIQLRGDQFWYKGGAFRFINRTTGSSVETMRIHDDGNVLPGADDAQDLGSATKRWDDIYATNGTIQTSDRQQKQDIEELSEAETRVAQACKGLLRKYRWKDQVATKGDEARIHFGIIAQDLEAAFAAEGLDAGRYGMFIKNTWWTADIVTPAVEAVEAVEAVYDEEGNEVSPAVEAVEAQPERTSTKTFDNVEDAPEGATEVTQRGVRYSELLAFIIAAI